MAKSMAVIADGVVTNVIWCSDSAPETDSRVPTAQRKIEIGDTCADGRFYRNGAEVLTETERLRAELSDMQAALEMLGVSADE